MTRVSFGVLLTLTSFLTGCGGFSGASAPLHDQATRICTAADRRLERVKAPRFPAGYQPFLKGGIAILEPELRRLRSLRPQGDERPVLAAALRAVAREISELKGAVVALERHQDAVLAFASLQRRLSPLEAQADAAWRALQVPACLTG